MLITIMVALALTLPSPVEVRTAATVNAAALCDAAAAGMKDMRWPTGQDARMTRCRDLAQHAMREGLPVEGVARVLAIAYNEANFRPHAVGARGELGMLQVLPRICTQYAPLKDGGCAPELAGIRYFSELLYADANLAIRAKKGGRSWARVLSAYNGTRRDRITRLPKITAYGYKVNGYAVALLHRWRKALAANL